MIGNKDSLLKESLLKEPFLVNYLNSSEFFEESDDFSLWTACSLIGAATRRKVFWEQLKFQVFCNLYIALVSKSATSRKSVAVGYGVSVWDRAFPDGIEGMTILQGNITTQAINKKLNPKKESPNSMLYAQCDELSVFLSKDVVQNGLTELLTEVYRCKKKHQYITKTAGEFTLRNCFFNIIATTQPHFLRENIGSSLMAGFVGRFTYCLQRTRKRKSAFLTDFITKESYNLYQDVLGEQLRAIGERSGEISFLDKGTKDVFRMYYNGLDDGEDDFKYDDSGRESGYVGRMGDHAIKLAIVHSLSREPFSREKPIITADDLAFGIKLTRNAKKHLESIFSLSNIKGPMEYLPEIREYIRERGLVARGNITRDFQKKVNADMLDNIVHSLGEADEVMEFVESRKIFYCWIPEKFKTEDTDDEMRRKTIDFHKERLYGRREKRKGGTSPSGDKAREWSV